MLLRTTLRPRVRTPLLLPVRSQRHVLERPLEPLPKLSQQEGAGGDAGGATAFGQESLGLVLGTAGIFSVNAAACFVAAAFIVVAVAEWVVAAAAVVTVSVAAVALASFLLLPLLRARDSPVSQNTCK